jgi:hypothetical protein
LTLSNEAVTFDRVHSQRFRFAGQIDAVSGSRREAALAGTGGWNGETAYAFEVAACLLRMHTGCDQRFPGCARTSVAASA